MKSNKFSKKEALLYGWEKTINNLGFFIGLIIVVWILSAGPGLIAEKLGDGFPTTKVLLITLGVILSIIIDMGLLKIGLNFADNKKGKLKDLFSQHQKFWKYIAGMILYLLMVSLGLILFIVPGIILAVKYQFVGYFIIDKNKGPIEALKESNKITKDSKWNLFLLGVLVILINFIGIFTFGIGMIFTIPTTQIAMAYVYRKLS